MPTLTCFGAAREVTGSCHLLESAGEFRLLLDCGMHQGGDDVKSAEQEKIQFDPRSIDAVVLSHGHLDHSGLLPKLVRQGFSRPIYCTSATADLLKILLWDAWGLYQRDLERENLRRERRGKKAQPAAYDAADVETVLSLCDTCGYGQPRQINQWLSLTFHDAGHILGSAIVELRMTVGGQVRTLVFSGDLGNSDSVLMRPPAILQKADLVLLEGTYGNRNHRSMDDTISQLTDILAETWNRRGNVLIPAFAVGRTQEILFYLGRLHRQGKLDNWRVYLDSPMAINVTGVYDHWLKLLDEADVRELNELDQQSFQRFLPSLILSQSSEDSMAINKVAAGAIIIAGSGMCTGGRIRHHIKHRIWQERNTMIFIGYQAQGSLGRLIVDGAQHIKLFRDQYAVRARIETLGGFSAHAGQRQLLDWFGHFDNQPQLALVHGELASLQALAEKFQAEQQVQARIPALGETLAF